MWEGPQITHLGDERHKGEREGWGSKRCVSLLQFKSEPKKSQENDEGVRSQFSTTQKGPSPTKKMCISHVVLQLAYTSKCQANPCIPSKQRVCVCMRACPCERAHMHCVCAGGWAGVVSGWVGANFSKSCSGFSLKTFRISTFVLLYHASSLSDASN